MEYRNLGSSGLRVSALGLGCNNFGHRMDPDAAAAVVHRALDLGIDLFDTADFYGASPSGEGKGRSEEYLGRALGGRRHEAVIATKFGMPMADGPLSRGGSRRYVLEAVQASLRRLNTDYIDLYQMHVPDPATPLEETLSVLDDLVRRGDVRYVGCCNFAGWQVTEAAWISRTAHQTPFVSAQNQWSLLVREIEREVLPACRKHGLGVLPWFPLAAGLLTGKYKKNEPAPPGSRLSKPTPISGRFLNERNFAMLGRLQAIAAQRGRTIGELAIAWLLAEPLVSSVIAGATRPEQLDDNVRALDWKLTAEERAEIDGATREDPPYPTV